MDFTDFTFTTVIVLVALVLASSATVVALVAFIRGAKAATEDFADPLRLSSASDLSRPGQGAPSIEDACERIASIDRILARFPVGKRVSFATNGGAKRRTGKIVKVRPTVGMAVVQTDDCLPTITTSRALHELTLLE